MDALYIISTYVLIDDTLKLMGFRDHHHAQVSTAEILTVAVIAAKYFQNHHERALCVLQLTHYIPKLSVSRFNRRLHQAWHLLQELLTFLAHLRLKPAAYIVDTMPLPVCRKVRADDCRKIPQTEGYIGWSASKQSWFCGWRLHWLCNQEGFPIAFDIVPAVWHELTTLQLLAADLPSESLIYGDGAYVSHDHRALLLASGIRLIARSHPGMINQNTALQRRQLRRYGNVIETAHSLLEKMGVQRLHAVTQAGFGIKVYASIFALACNCLFNSTLFTSN